MKTIKEMIEVMKAFDEGKEIEYCTLDEFYKPNGEYTRKNDVIPFNWYDFDYRIKTEYKKRPMTFEEVVAYWKEHRTELYNVSDRSGYIITGFDYENEQIQFPLYALDLQDFLDIVTKEDGTKFEVEE